MKKLASVVVSFGEEDIGDYLSVEREWERKLQRMGSNTLGCIWGWKGESTKAFPAGSKKHNTFTANVCTWLEER